MSESGMRADVHGDVHGPVVMGDRNITVTGGHVAFTMIEPGEHRPRPRLREDATLLPRRPRGVVGRDRQLEVLAEMIPRGGAVQIHGDPGIGKSTLLREAAHRLSAQGRNVVYVPATGLDAGDVLQEVFESCYDAPGYRPARGELRRLLARVGVCLLVDDLEVPDDELERVLDTAAAATVLYTARERASRSDGHAFRLEGFGRDDAFALLEEKLRRPLYAREVTTAEALWQACRGAPLPLARAAAVADRPDRELPRPAELESLLPLVVAGLDPVERYTAAALVLAGDGGVDGRALAALVPDGAAARLRLTALGVSVPTGSGYRLAPDMAPFVDALSPTPAETAELAGRFRAWLSAADRVPADVAAHSGLVAGLVDALAATGRAREGVALARATAPRAALALRMAAWGRILDRGKGAAESSGDRRGLAYFTQELAVRDLLTGRVAAGAAGIAAAAVLWRALGEHGRASVAEQAGTQFGPGQVTSGPGTAPSTGGGESVGSGQGGLDGHGGLDGSGGHGGSGSHGGSGGPGSSGGHGEPGGHGTPGGPGGPGGHVGLGLTGKVVLGGGLLALAAGGVGLGFRAMGSDTVPVRIRVESAIINVQMPGEPEGRCVRAINRTNCTTVIKPVKGKRGPVAVEPDGPVPDGVRFLYYGCDQGGAAASCTVRADREKTVCITSSSRKDAAARATCARLTAQQPAGGREWPFSVQLGTGWKVSVDGAPVQCPPKAKTKDELPARSCEFKLAEGQKITLTATLGGPDPDPVARAGGKPGRRGFDPIWYGCDDQGPQRVSCTVTMSRARVQAAERLRSTGIQPDSVNPFFACVTTWDFSDSGAMYACARAAGAEPPSEQERRRANGAAE